MSHKELLPKLAERIKVLRLRKQWSRRELADRAEVNVFTLKHFERTGQISLDRFLSICDALGFLQDFERLLKPRERVNIDQWTVPERSLRQRGRRREPATKAEQSVTKAVLIDEELPV